jgi:tetratricopeptide (TPR) repeat protein
VSDLPEQLPPPSGDLQRADQLITAKNYDQALAVLRRYWLNHPQDCVAVRLLSRAMKALGKADLAGNLYRLSEQEQALSDDLVNLCEAGANLIDAREMQLAVMVLQHCAAKLPDDPTVAYELGFALMALNKFAAAIPYFEKSMLEKSTDDFDTRLNLCVCHQLTRDVTKARQQLDKLKACAQTEEQKNELAHRHLVDKRLERFQKKSTLTPRDWAFILYGTVVLSEPSLDELSIAKVAHMKRNQSEISGLITDTAGKSGATEPDYKAIAWTLLVLEKLLNALGYEFDLIEFYSPLSRPLAEAIAHKLDLPAKSFRGETNTDRSLMLMAWAPNIIGPHQSFTRNGRKRILFSYGLSTTQPLPLTPDVVAEFCTHLRLPWAESADEDTVHRATPGKVDLPDLEQAKAADQIVAAIAELESQPEMIQTVEELTNYYLPKVEQLVLGNPEVFKERPTYTAEIVF